MTVDTLPVATSSNLHLDHPTDQENGHIWQLSSTEWKDALTIPQYLEESAYLMTVPLARDQGMTQWILVDKNLAPNQRPILASCETFRKRSLIRDRDGRCSEVVVHGIGSVYCNPRYRGRGYASRLLQELSQALPNWQCDNTKCVASVLFSDINPDFYRNLGWHPFSSSHIELQPAAVQHSASPLHAGDLPKLCALDEQLLRRAMKNASNPVNPRLVIIPDHDHMRWHHSEEEFVCQKLFGKQPEVKGAIVGQPGRRIWAIWTHRFYGHPTDASSENTLYILRFAVEDRCPLDTDSDCHIPPTLHQLHGVRAVLQAAQAEAAEWNLHKVKLWHPSRSSERIIRLAGIRFRRKYRIQDSVPCLQWYGGGEGTPNSVDWLLNEKYAWC